MGLTDRIRSAIDKGNSKEVLKLVRENSISYPNLNFVSMQKYATDKGESEIAKQLEFQAIAANDLKKRGFGKTTYTTDMKRSPSRDTPAKAARRLREKAAKAAAKAAEKAAKAGGFSAGENLLV